jgi:hypothetical protein
MKKLFFMAVAALLINSCTSENFNDVNNSKTAQSAQSATAPVRVHVRGFSVSQEDFPSTRATQAVSNYDAAKVLTLAFYSGSTEVLKVTQVKSDNTTYTTFGEFECSLPMGSYTMVVLAHDKLTDDALVLTSPTAAAYTEQHSRETFAATQVVNITNTNAVDISATLNRIVTKLRVVSSDTRTANAASVRMTFSTGGQAFNPTTGFATVNTGFSNTVNISASVGQTTSSVTYFFLASDDQTIDVTIETLDADGNTLFTKTINDVPFKRNRMTQLTGAMYTNDAISGAFQLNTSWLTDYNADF